MIWLAVAIVLVAVLTVCVATVVELIAPDEPKIPVNWPIRRDDEN